MQTVFSFSSVLISCLLDLPACIHTVGILGPMFGFLLGSFLAKIYVDIGSVDLGKDTQNHNGKVNTWSCNTAQNAGVNLERSILHC